METPAPLRLFDSLTRSLKDFVPLRAGEASVYSCGPTVYNYQHVGNMRAYIFADTLGRALSFKGYKLKHVVNITDVGHLTSDADAGDDKLEKAASAQGKSAWDIARYYQQVFEDDLARLNIRKPEHPRATDYVPGMIAWAQGIEAEHCYTLPGGLYFDVSTVPDYGRLARAETNEGEARIESVDGKRHAADFAIWRTTPPGETRQMEWDSPWGRGAPGWHIECSVMSAALLGQPFDIHTGGIDHREIHHPNEIAQNQAHGCTAESGAGIWMHNNFLIDRSSSKAGGKMSKSSGEFLTLQALVDRGYHPLAFRLLCLQAHYRSELEFSWEGLGAALVRLKRMFRAVNNQLIMEPEATGQQALAPERYEPIPRNKWQEADWEDILARFDEAISEDLNIPKCLPLIEELLGDPTIGNARRWHLIATMDEVLGLNILKFRLSELRRKPTTTVFDETEIEAILARRKDARAAKDFATSDALRDELSAHGVEVMDGDPLGWDWKLG